MQVGDLVWSYDTETSKWSWQPVASVFWRWYSGEVVTLTLGADNIITTGNHPVWVVSGTELSARAAAKELPISESALTSTGRWVEARDLLLGDTVLSKSGATVTLSAAAMRQDSIRVFNFEVERTHTYTVGSHSILVHNAGCHWHHIMTNKHSTKWTAKFTALAKKAGMRSLDDAANRVQVAGHGGPHPEAYHQQVFDRLKRAIDGRDGDDAKSAFRAELDKIGQECATPGSALNKLITK